MTIKSEISPIAKIRPYLPSSVSQAISRLDNSLLDRISEIRLRANGVTSITIDGKNKFLTNSGLSTNTANAIYISHEDIEDFIYKFCKGSVYSHQETLKDFYITNEAVRVGLSGEGTGSRELPKGIGKVTSVNIRIPRHIFDCSENLMQYIEEKRFEDGKGILIISSPGVGKTTLLRDLAIKLSTPPGISSQRETMRVCVIDERREIFMNRIFSECCIDFLFDVSKLKGLEISSRVLSPEIIICDEIAGPEEAEKITRYKNGGVIFIASFHADSYESVIKKDYIKAMFDSGVFGAVYELKRIGGKVCGKLYEYVENA